MHLPCLCHALGMHFPHIHITLSGRKNKTQKLKLISSDLKSLCTSSLKSVSVGEGSIGASKYHLFWLLNEDLWLHSNFKNTQKCQLAGRLQHFTIVYIYKQYIYMCVYFIDLMSTCHYIECNECNFRYDHAVQTFL